MKHKIYKYVLSLLRRVAKLIQIGNPAGRAPSLLNEPLNMQQLEVQAPLPKSMAVWQLPNTLCSGLYGGVVINAQNQVYDRFLIYPWGKELHPCLTFPYLGNKKLDIQKAVFLITVATKANYYHWIADLLPRLLLVQKCGLADFHERSFILHQPERCYEHDTLRLLEIAEEKVIRLQTFETIAVKDLVIADYLHSRDGQHFPAWKKELLNEFKAKVLGPESKKGDRKIYLLRGKQRTRKLLGEERLVHMLQELGFEIMDPQQLSLLEQMHILSQAAVVVALHGAALTNIIFCKEGTLIVELRSSHKPPEYYSEIAKTYQLQFETISLKPERVLEPRHLANEQDLHLSEKSLETLLSTLQMYEVQHQY
ncbi:Tetratricopeptide TPR_2 repeat-containing protein [Flammeovirgaceae bacterium 311]|nr:Tetratricopeptide TPR_2 repeat-containing protein [Flammeovirgaceae bacterium 311]